MIMFREMVIDALWEDMVKTSQDVPRYREINSYTMEGAKAPCRL